MANLIPYEQPSTSIIREEAPIVEICTHLNTAYINFKFPSSGTSKTDIYKVSVHITEYGSLSSGEINTHIVLSELIMDFFPARTAYAKNNDSVPLHHVYYSINNSWYVFRFTYMYTLETSSDGGDIFYSKVGYTKVNNTMPSIFEGYISKYITGELSTSIRQTRTINLAYETLYTPEINILIKDIEPGIRVITGLFDSNTYTTGPAPESFMTFLLSLFNNELFYSTVMGFFNVETIDELPENDTIIFIFKYNHEQCLFKIEGNIKQLIEKYNKGRI